MGENFHYFSCLPTLRQRISPFFTLIPNYYDEIAQRHVAWSCRQRA